MPHNLLTPQQETLMRQEVKQLRLLTAQLSKSNKLLKDKATSLEKENKSLRFQIRLLSKKIKLLESEIINLKNQKKTYTGMIFKPNPKEKTRSQRGNKSGYIGSSRFNPKPEDIDQVINVKYDLCPDCGNKLKTYNRIYEHIVEDIVLPVKKTRVVKYQKCRQYCPHCRKEKIAFHENEIPNSNFGPVLSSLILFLKYKHNMSIPNIQNLLSVLFEMKITISGIQSQLSISKRHFENAYSDILRSIRASPVKHADETSWRIDGLNAWTWILCNELETYFQIEETRGAGVAKALIQSSDKDSVLVRDDYGAYTKLGLKHQSCWAHLLRKAKDYVSFEGSVASIKKLESELKQMFTDLSVFLETDPSQNEREIKYKDFLNSIDLIIKRKYKKDSYAQKIQKRIANQHENLLTAVLVKGVPLTNNLAERDLRPLVINRKISGGSRSRKGAEITAVNKSVVQTLNKRGIDLMNGLEMLIKGHSLEQVSSTYAENT